MQLVNQYQANGALRPVEPSANNKTSEHESAQ